MVSKLLKSKTIWYATAIAVLSVLQGFVQIIPTNPMWQALIGCGIAIGIVILRFLTTEPLENK